MGGGVIADDELFMLLGRAARSCSELLAGRHGSQAGRQVIDSGRMTAGCYLKPLDVAAVVNLDDLFRIRGEGGGGGSVGISLCFRPLLVL